MTERFKAEIGRRKSEIGKEKITKDKSQISTKSEMRMTERGGEWRVGSGGYLLGKTLCDSVRLCGTLCSLW